jgi:hypothetical protein
MAYVYRHIREDKNQPFYIGIGSDSNGNYIRANSNRRNSFWKLIVSKTKYIVEIIFDDLTWAEACDKEKELIKLYGRKDLGTGILVNLTDGGDGSENLAKEVKDRISKKITLLQTGIPCPEETKLKISKTLMGHKNSPSIPCSDEKAAKISKVLKGRPLSKEHCMALKVPKKVKVIITKERCDNIRKAKLGLKQPKVICPYCDKEGGQAAMTRYHFDNCKKKNPQP